MVKNRAEKSKERYPFIRSRDRKQQFVRAAIKAKELYGDKAFVFGNKTTSGRTLSRINKITFNKKKRTIKIDRTPLYTVKGNRKVVVTRTNFMKRAAMGSAEKIEGFFIQEAQKQIKKYMQ